MPVTITFNKFSEKKPEHGQDVIWLSQTSSFGYRGFYPKEIQAEYLLEGYNEKDGYTGWSAGYNGESEEEAKELGYRIGVLFDGHIAEPNDLWIGVEEYWKCFEEVLSK